MNDTPKIEDKNAVGPAMEALGDAEVPNSTDLETLASDVYKLGGEARAWERSELLKTSRGQAHFDKTLEEEVAGFPNVPQLALYFYERWPSYAAAQVDHLQSAKTSIQSGQMSQIVNVGDVVSNWSGEAKEDFKGNFLDPFIQPVNPNQQLIFEELTTAMLGYQALLEAARRDLKKVLDDAKKVLESIMAGDKSPTDTTNNLDMIGAVIAVAGVVAGFAAAPVTGGTTAVLALGLLGAGVAATKTLISMEQSFTSNTAIGVMDELGKKLDGMKKQMDEEEESLVTALEISHGSMSASVTSTDPLSQAALLPNEPDDDGTPNISDGEVPGHGDFHPPR